MSASLAPPNGNYINGETHDFQYDCDSVYLHNVNKYTFILRPNYNLSFALLITETVQYKSVKRRLRNILFLE